MKLTKQTINRNIVEYENGLLNNKYHFQNFYIAFGLAYCQLEDMKIVPILTNDFTNIRNILFKKITYDLVIEAINGSLVNGRPDFEKAKRIYSIKADKSIRQFQEIIGSDRAVINKFNSVFDKIQSESDEIGDLDTPDSIGIAETEFESDD